MTDGYEGESTALAGMNKLMTVEQKRVASWIAIAVLVLGVLWLAWLVYKAGTSSFVDDPASEEPKLLLAWSIALWFVELGTSVKVLFAGVIAVITSGMAAAGEFYKNTRQIALIAVLCLAGIGLCVVMMVLLGDGSRGEILRYFSKYETLPEIESAADAFLWSVLGWFTLFLLSQLGISAVKQGGVVRNLLARFSG